VGTDTEHPEQVKGITNNFRLREINPALWRYAYPLGEVVQRYIKLLIIKKARNIQQLRAINQLKKRQYKYRKNYNVMVIFSSGVGVKFPSAHVLLSEIQYLFYLT